MGRGLGLLFALLVFVCVLSIPIEVANFTLFRVFGWVVDHKEFQSARSGGHTNRSGKSLPRSLSGTERDAVASARTHGSDGSGHEESEYGRTLSNVQKITISCGRCSVCTVPPPADLAHALS